MVWVRSLVIGLVLVAFPAAAEDQMRRVVYDGTVMSLLSSENALEISYIEPPAILREAGVAQGSILVKGTWEGQTLRGDAFVYSKGCDPLGYSIRGVIERSGQLVVMGHKPVEVQDCHVFKSAWDEMRFEPREYIRSKPEAKAKPKPKPEPKPKAKPKPRARPAAPVQQPYPYYPGGWRW